MAHDNGNSVLHRKTQVAREDFDARGMSPSKALRLALSKAADGLLGLAVTVSTVEQVKLPQTAIESDIGNTGLLMLLDGTQGRRGAMMMDQSFLSALIEVQTMGYVRKADAQDRPLTRTDAAIAAPLIDEMLRLFDVHMEDAMAGHIPAEFRFGDMIEDTRALALAMEQPDYDRFRITADLGQGAKTGVLDILLPKAPPPTPVAGQGPRGVEDSDTLKGSAMNAPVVLNAVMARISMPLDQICNLKEGQVMAIAREAISELQLLGADNHLVASVKLGQVNGWRAVRLLGPEAPADDVEQIIAPTSVEQREADAAVTASFANPSDDTGADANMPKVLSGPDEKAQSNSQPQPAAG
jgi:flagellar motor switch protein FliM